MSWQERALELAAGLGLELLRRRLEKFASRVARAAERRRATLLVALAALGVFFAADDQTSVVTVLPEMINGIGLPQDRFYRAAWIVNAYILGYVVAMPLLARIADIFGHGRVFAATMAVFVLGSIGVAVSGDLTTISVMRAVQAVGAGAAVPVSMAIVVDFASLERRALGLGAIAAASEAGGLMGPLWGGGMVGLFGWTGVFWVNVPLCLPIAAAVWWLAPQLQRQRAAVDWPGAALLGGSLVALTVALTNDPIAPRPAAATVALFALAAGLLALFVLRQRRAPAPLIDLSLLRRLPVSAGFLTNALTGATLIVAMVNMPLFTNTVLGDSALDGGLNLMRLTVALPAGALLGGYLARRAGYRLVTCCGLLLTAAGFWGLSRWDLDPTALQMTLPALAAGFGFGLVIAPIHAAVLDEAEESDRATVASLLVVVRLLGALVGVALLTTQGLGSFYEQAGLVPLDDPRFVEQVQSLQVDTFRDTFLATAAVCLVSILPALLLGGRRGDLETRSAAALRSEAR